MKVFELFESDDDKMRKLNDAARKLHAEVMSGVEARKAMHNAMFKNHKWMYDVGDMIQSKKTGMIYTITDQYSTKYHPRDENHRVIKGAEPQLVPAYRYKAGDEEGTLLEPLIKPGMFTLITKGKNIRTSSDED